MVLHHAHRENEARAPVHRDFLPRVGHESIAWMKQRVSTGKRLVVGSLYGQFEVIQKVLVITLPGWDGKTLRLRLNNDRPVSAEDKRIRFRHSILAFVDVNIGQNVSSAEHRSQFTDHKLLGEFPAMFKCDGSVRLVRRQPEEGRFVQCFQEAGIL